MDWFCLGGKLHLLKTESACYCNCMNNVLQITAYLLFNGNCRQGMRFYQTCFGGQLAMQSLAETEGAKKIPVRLKKLVLSATLKTPYFTLMGSDLPFNESRVAGNQVSLMLTVRNKTRLKEIGKRLAAGSGKALTLPLPASSGGTVLTVRDQYGNLWTLQCP